MLSEWIHKQLHKVQLILTIINKNSVLKEMEHLKLEEEQLLAICILQVKYVKILNLFKVIQFIKLL